MTTPSDEDLVNMGMKYFYYKTRSATGDSITAQMDATEKANLEQQIKDFTDKITLAEIEEETANETYLSMKENPGKYGLFSAIGLRTTQDWVLAYFFFAYIVFSVLIVLTSARESHNMVGTGLTMAAIMFPIGVLLFIGVMTFG
jgi:hypothetical protein